MPPVAVLATSNRLPRSSEPGTRARPNGSEGTARASVEVVVAAGEGTLLHPVIRPSGAPPGPSNSSVKRNRAGVSTPDWVILKSVVGLNTMPNGEEAPTSRGTFTTGSASEVAPRYSVIALVGSGLNWLLTHSGVG